MFNMRFNSFFISFSIERKEVAATSLKNIVGDSYYYNVTVCMKIFGVNQYLRSSYIKALLKC